MQYRVLFKLKNDSEKYNYGTCDSFEGAIRLGIKAHEEGLKQVEVIYLGRKTEPTIIAFRDIK